MTPRSPLGSAARSDEFAPRPDAFDRRALLKAAASTLALAGLSACQPDERALPYVNAPEFTVPGKPRWYATSVMMMGYAQPVLGKTHVGRPVKLEGNPDHPASQGRTDAFTQAALLGLYEPDRSPAPLHNGRPATEAMLAAELAALRQKLDADGGEGCRLLTGTVTSPTLLRQIAELSQHWPALRWHVFEPFNEDLRRAGARRATGRALDRQLALDAAEIVISLDDDLLGPGPHQTRHAAAWAKRRTAARAGPGGAALLVAEPTPTLTGVAATDRLIATPAQVETLLGALAQRLGVIADGPAEAGWSAGARWLSHAQEALLARRGASLVSLGPHYSADLHALALLINQALGAIGRTYRLDEPIAGVPPDGDQSFEILCADMAQGRVHTVMLLDGNPVFTAPPQSDFGACLEKVALRIHAGLHRDETARACHWHLPIPHALESWSDARAVDGTLSVIQPLIRPFHDVMSIHVLLDRLMGGDRSDYAIVQDTWRTAWGDAFDANWRNALAKGFVADSARRFDAPPTFQPAPAWPRTATEEGLTVILRPDATLWDGRFGNNAWLQETPKPISKISWGNGVAISPALARRLGVANGAELHLTHQGRTLTGPAWITPGQAETVICVTAGQGRALPDQLADHHGYDARALSFDGLGRLTGARIAPTGRSLVVATTQPHGEMDGFDFVKTVSLADLTQAAEPRTDVAPKTPGPSFYPLQPRGDPAWGMAIDLDACIGCQACVVACVAENNIAMVGPEQVARGRAMAWLRVDRYAAGNPDEPALHFQPVPCMHCEQAPCEMGCPVNATTHSPDGLNQQIYNRCIGTRTCSSYCPYKVRHFNWFDFTASDPPSLQAARNPDVTVRQRGVMEKCTYCVQRISAARIEAKIAGRAIRDGDVVTACQQACPTQAITFGNIADPDSAVSRRKAEPRDYTLLEEANTRPRTTYLAKVRDPERGV